MGGIPQPRTTDEIVSDVRDALDLADLDALTSVVVIAEYIPMDGDGEQVMVWSCSHDLPFHRAVGMLTTVVDRLLQIGR